MAKALRLALTIDASAHAHWHHDMLSQNIFEQLPQKFLVVKFLSYFHFDIYIISYFRFALIQVQIDTNTHTLMYVHNIVGTLKLMVSDTTLYLLVIWQRVCIQKFHLYHVEYECIHQDLFLCTWDGYIHIDVICSLNNYIHIYEQHQL